MGNNSSQATVWTDSSVIMSIGTLGLSGSLTSRCLQAGGWVGFGELGTRLIRMARLMVLTYLLSPEQMGEVSLAVGLMAMLQEFSDVGIKHALIQNPRGLERAYLDTAWLVNLLRGGLLALILVASAGSLAELYDKPILVSLLRLSALIALLDGVGSISLTTLQKQLRFGRVTLVQMANYLVGTVAAVAFSYWLRDARGVLIGEVIGMAVGCGLSYLIDPYRPGWQWNRDAFKSLFVFGLIAYLVTLIDAVGMRIDLLMLGKIGTGPELGLYTLGLAVAAVIRDSFSRLMVVVGYPALCLVAQNRQTMRQAVAKLLRWVALAATPIFFGMMVLADDIVKMLPAAYAQVGMTLRWLSLAAFLLTLIRAVAPALYALNRVYWCVLRGGLQLVLVGLLTPWWYHLWGMMGVCLALAVGTGLANLVMLIAMLRELEWHIKDFLRYLAPWFWAVAGGTITALAAALIAQGSGKVFDECLMARLAILLAGLLGYSLAGGLSYRRYRNAPCVPLAANPTGDS